MTPERWQKIEELFEATSLLPKTERSAFLDKVCEGDSDLRREVESLIDSHERAGAFLSVPAFELVPEFVQEQLSSVELGQRLDHYRILDAIGEGGMAQVYLAKDIRLGRQVALKLLPPAFTSDSERVHRFEREARAASALNHPNIITIYEIGQTGDIHFIATEFIDGVSLRKKIEKDQLQHQEILEIAIQVASALSAAHEAGIVHRDIKPENIMLRYDGLVKVLDFGIAKLTGKATHRDSTESTAPTKPVGKTEAGV